jgi:hypothetical protein
LLLRQILLQQDVWFYCDVPGLGFNNVLREPDLNPANPAQSPLHVSASSQPHISMLNHAPSLQQEAGAIRSLGVGAVGTLASARHLRRTAARWVMCFGLVGLLGGREGGTNRAAWRFRGTLRTGCNAIHDALLSNDSGAAGAPRREHLRLAGGAGGPALLVCWRRVDFWMSVSGGCICGGTTSR